jgi:hypothetical protein
MRDIEQLVERYLAAERDLVTAVDAVGGTVALPDSRMVIIGRAESDALLGRRCKRAWVIIRKNRRCWRGDERWPAVRYRLTRRIGAGFGRVRRIGQEELKPFWCSKPAGPFVCHYIAT